MDEPSASVPRFAVIGNPIAHSRSPEIHAAFAHQTGLRLSYERVLAPVDGFSACVAQLRALSVVGANVTLPFKLDAFAIADEHTARARSALAANTLAFRGGRILADNTDGAGLVGDLARILAEMNRSLSEQSVLILGAGGAARGVVLPLLEAGVARIFIANRTRARADELVNQFAGSSERVSSLAMTDLSDLAPDIIINATSAGLRGTEMRLDAVPFDGVTLAYDMAYGGPARQDSNAFLCTARERGASRFEDGLGMLIEQAAESFALWHGVRPQTAGILRALRADQGIAR